MRYKVAVRFAIEGDLRFISHRDTIRLFERALSRSNLPVKFTQGFNPRPKTSLPVPRPVGVASRAEILLIELDELVEPAHALARLAEQVPEGVELLAAHAAQGRRAQPADRATCEVRITPEQASSVADALQRLLAAPTWPIEREEVPGRPGRTIDLRAWLCDARLCDGALQWTVRITAEGTVRPAEFLAAVGLAPEQWLHRVRRTDIRWPAPEASSVPEARTCDTDTATT